MATTLASISGFEPLNPRDCNTLPPPERPRVFVVDDDEAVRTAVTMLVRTCGWEVVPCADAEDFLACYTPCSDQCLVVDLCMPGMGGLELQRELRHRGDGLPVIVVTAHHDLPDVQFAIEHGAQAVLRKPFKGQELLGWIRRALEA
jgi:FixJ family two-component response regulator